MAFPRLDIFLSHAPDRIDDEIAKAIKEAAIIVPFCTKQYEESKYCKQELQRADELGVPIIPVKTDKNFKWADDGWMGVVLTKIIDHVIHLDNFDDVIDDFCKVLERILERQSN